MRKRKKPIITMTFETYKEPLPTDEVVRIEQKVLSNIVFSKIDDQRFIFDTVVFDHCTFEDSVFDHCEFIDCKFTQSSFITTTFSHATFVRAEFINCKFSAVHVSDSLLEHLLFKETICPYLDIINTSFKMVEFEHVQLDESTWFENKFDQVIFHEVSLVKADFYKTSLKNIDLSTCQIDGLKIDLYDIKGATIAPYQAQYLCHLIGVKIGD